MSFNIFDPSQWADVSGFAIVVVMSLLTIAIVLGRLVASAKWTDWLDETHGRGSVDDPWENDNAHVT